jgi:hypothetical protein
MEVVGVPVYRRTIFLTGLTPVLNISDLSLLV